MTMAPALLTGASGPDSDRKGGRVRAQFPQLQDAHSAVLRLGGGVGVRLCVNRGYHGGRRSSVQPRGAARRRTVLKDSYSVPGKCPH